MRLKAEAAQPSATLVLLCVLGLLLWSPAFKVSAQTTGLQNLAPTPSSPNANQPPSLAILDVPVFFANASVWGALHLPEPVVARIRSTVQQSSVPVDLENLAVADINGTLYRLLPAKARARRPADLGVAGDASPPIFAVLLSEIGPTNSSAVAEAEAEAGDHTPRAPAAGAAANKTAARGAGGRTRTTGAERGNAITVLLTLANPPGAASGLAPPPALPTAAGVGGPGQAGPDAGPLPLTILLGATALEATQQAAAAAAATGVGPLPLPSPRPASPSLPPTTAPAASTTVPGGINPVLPLLPTTNLTTTTAATNLLAPTDTQPVTGEPVSSSTPAAATPTITPTTTSTAPTTVTAPTAPTVPTTPTALTSPATVTTLRPLPPTTPPSASTTNTSATSPAPSPAATLPRAPTTPALPATASPPSLPGSTKPGSPGPVPSIAPLPPLLLNDSAAPVTMAPSPAPARSPSPRSSSPSPPRPASPPLINTSSPSPSPAQGQGQGQGSAVITILHFNDWHNRMESTAESYNGLCDGKVDLGRCTGGIARMKKWLDDSRARYGGRDAVLTLNSGDDFIGTVWDRKYGVNQAAHFLGLLQLDASVIGNHEFDWGPDKLSDYLASVAWPVLGAANLEIPKGHRMQELIKSYISRTMQGYKVCVFGLATIETNPSQAYPIKVKDPYWAAKQLVPKMQKDGCQVIILLSHMGYTSDIVAAQIIPGLHLVVGGHSHALLWNGPAPLWDKNDRGSVDRVWGSYPTWVDSKVQSGVRTPVVQAGWGSRYMGTVQLHLRPPGNSGGSVVAKVEGWPSLLGGDRSDTPYSQDRAMLAEIRKWRYW